MTGPFRRFNDYDFRHWVATQAEAGADELVHRLIGLTDREGHNCWFAAREQRNELEGYAADLQIARSLADSSAHRRGPRRSVNVGLQSRYALLAALIRDLAANQLPELAARYVQAGMWSRDQALAWARLGPDPQQSLRTLVDGLRADEGSRRQELARLALETGASIADSDNRVLAVAALASDLPPGFHARALEIVAEERNEGSRLGGLRSLTPHLPPELRQQALKVAEGMQDPILKAEAIATVARSLEEPQQSHAFKRSLSVARAVAESKDDAALLGFARSLPRQWLIEFCNLVGRNSPNGLASSPLLALYLTRIAEESPERVLELAKLLPKWNRDDVLLAVALCFARRGQWDEALNAAKRASSLGLETDADLWEAIVKAAPETEWQMWVKLFRPLSSYRRLEMVRRLVASADVPAPRLRDLAATFEEQRESIEASAAMARALSPGQIGEVLEAALSDEGYPASVFADLAPFLCVGQVRAALDRIPPSGLLEEATKALLVRLAELGESDEAICRVAEVDLLESERAKVLMSLANHVSNDRLPDIRRATRPRNVDLECVRARGALLPWLPEIAAAEIAAAAGALRDPCDRASALSEILPTLPCGLAKQAARDLLAGIPELFLSASLDRDHITREVFRAMSQALSRSFSPELNEEAISLATNAVFSREGQLALLLDLASAGDNAPHVRESIQRAFGILVEDTKLVSTYAAGLTEGHRPVLADLLRGLDDVDQILALLAAAASLLEPSSLDLAVERIARHDDLESRVLAASIVMSLAPKAERKRLARKLELPASELRARLARLPLRERIRITGMLTQNGRAASELLEEAFLAACRLPGRERPAAIADLATELTASQLAIAIDDLAETSKGVVTGPLLDRAVELGDAALVTKCVSAEANNFTRSRLIERIAPWLELDLLPHVAPLEEAEASQEGMGSLAVRAAELGDISLALEFLDRKGSTTFSGDRTIESIYRAAPAASADLLIERAGRMRPAERATALVELVGRLPIKKRKPVIESILSGAKELIGARDEQRLEVIRSLAPELARFPVSGVISIWTNYLAQSASQGREEVLVDVRAFAPILVASLGEDVALGLNESIRFAGVVCWP